MGTYKTDWQLTGTVMPEDFNRIEGNIKENNTNLEEFKKKYTTDSKEENKKIDAKAEKDDVILKVPIPEDRDCNSFKDLNSFCVFDTGAGAFKNTPEGTLDIGTSRVFMLINKGYNQGRFQQEFINLYPQDRITRYVRNFNADGNGNWGNWWKVYDEANKPTAAELKVFGGSGFYSSGTDLNNLVENGAYEINEISKCINGIQGVYDWGTLVVFNSKRIPQNDGQRITQIYYPHIIKDGIRIPYMRVKNNVNWTEWAPVTKGFSWNDLLGKPSSFPPADHNHDNKYFTRYAPRIKGVDINTYSTGGFYSVVHHEQPCTNLPVATDGYLMVIPWSSGEWCSQIFINDNEGDMYIRTKTGSEVNQWSSWGKVYDSNHKPTPADIGAWSSTDVSQANQPYKVVQRDNAGDVTARLLRSSYQDDNYINGAIAFRTNNKDDNYTRYCNNPTAVREWVDASPSNHNHDNVYLGKKGEVNDSSDFNSITEAGMYKVQGISANTPNSPIKAIPNLYAFGILLVFKSNVESEDRVLQVYYPHQAWQSTKIPVSRMKNNNDWTPWERVTNGLTASDVGARPSNWNPTWNDVQDKPNSFPPSSHNHDDSYIKKELGSTGESFRFRTKFLEFGVDDSRLGEIGVGPNDTYLHNTKSDKYFALKDNGELLYDNKKVLRDIQGSPLWQGFHHMAGKETVTPSKSLSQCNNGWVLVWSDWDDGVGTQDWNFCFTYIPKNTPWKNGKNHTFPLSAGEDTWAIKTLYVYDTYFRGNDTNKNGGNYDVILRAVLEY